MPLISPMSPTGVEVAWALTCLMSAPVRPASCTAICMARMPPRHSGSGWTMSYPSEVTPAPAKRAMTRAPRAAAWSARSRMIAPAPSPRTNPSRFLSQGRDARSGSSLRVDMARIEAKPAIGSGWMTASVPPATTTSARPDRMMSRPSDMASAPVAHALAIECTPALAPSSRPTYAAGPLGISIGTVCGLTRRGPEASRMSSWMSRVCAPPMPLPKLTASRSGSRPASARPESAHAWCAALSAIASERSSRRSFTRSRTSEGSTASWAAMRTGSCSAHSWVSALTPERPASMASQVGATDPPNGVVAPSPVTTTSVLLMSVIRLDVGNGVADGLEVLHLVVRDLDAELLLGGHHHLDHRQRVDVQVVGEGLLLGDVVRVHPGDLLEDLGEAGGDLFASCHLLGVSSQLVGRCSGRSGRPHGQRTT